MRQTQRGTSPGAARNATVHGAGRVSPASCSMWKRHNPALPASLTLSLLRAQRRLGALATSSEPNSDARPLWKKPTAASCWRAARYGSPCEDGLPWTVPGDGEMEADCLVCTKALAASLRARTTDAPTASRRTSPPGCPAPDPHPAWCCAVTRGGNIGSNHKNKTFLNYRHRHRKRNTDSWGKISHWRFYSL